MRGFTEEARRRAAAVTSARIRAAYEDALRDYLWCGGPSMTAAQGAERFGVNIRTIVRWRRSIREGRISD